MIDERVGFLWRSGLFVVAATCGGTGFFILFYLLGAWAFAPKFMVIGLSLVLVALVIQRAMESRATR